MITVKNLSKTYKSKKNNRLVKALRSINFTLPDTGLVFITGKSGSGKSTLLNMLGGLDEITEGEIIVNGNNFSDFKTLDYDNYRNSFTGFVFQDFYLLDSFTVAENVCFSLDLLQKTDMEKVTKALTQVDLDGFGKRYPNELSGGQKQRVAIARAIVKDPKVIFADEPTGNLDSKTGKQILDLLKSLSKDRLILVVSHNLSDAYKYADRIIELSDGKIVSDLVKRDNFVEGVEIHDDTIKIPYLNKITEQEEKDIEKALATGNIKKIVQCDDKFVPVTNIETNNEKTEIKNIGFSFKRLFEITLNFLKGSLVRSIVSSFMIACVVVILTLSQLIVTFDASTVIRNGLISTDQKELVLQKNSVYEGEKILNYANSTIHELPQSDIDAFYNSGYKGNIFELINYSLSINNYQITQQSLSAKNNIKWAFYISESFGTLITEPSFLINKYGENGELKLLCGDVDANPEGVIITDYFADCIIKNKRLKDKTYKDLLGQYTNSGGYNDGYINAIIDTGYKQRYDKIIKEFSKKEPNLVALAHDPKYLMAYDEISQFLGIAYTFNKNFKEDCKSIDVKTCISLGEYTINNIDIKDFTNGRSYLHYDSELKDGEISLSYGFYNNIFQTEYDAKNYKTFVPHKITIRNYRSADDLFTTPLHTVEVTISKLSNSRSTVITTSKSVFEEFRSDEFMSYSLYFDSLDNFGKVYSLGMDSGYIPDSVNIQSVATMSKAVGVFSDFFMLIAFVLFVACALILCSFGTKMVKDKTYEMGVIKALGGKNFNLSIIFVMQVIAVGLLTCILSWIGLGLFLGVANDILVASLSQLASTNIVTDLDFLIFNPGIMSLNCLGIIVLSVISTLAPINKLRKIKPINIIKASE